MVKQRLGQLLLQWLNVTLVQVRPQQTDAAVDVKADATCRMNRPSATLDLRDQHLPTRPTWRHHSLGVAHVERRHVSDGKPVSGVNVGEADGPLTDNQKVNTRFNTFSFGQHRGDTDVDDSRQRRDVSDLFHGWKEPSDTWTTIKHTFNRC